MAEEQKKLPFKHLEYRWYKKAYRHLGELLEDAHRVENHNFNLKSDANPELNMGHRGGPGPRGMPGGGRISKEQWRDILKKDVQRLMGILRDPYMTGLED